MPDIGSHPHFKLGKAPARPDAVKLKLKRYIAPRKLPKLPKTFGHERLIEPRGWGMLGNDQYGCCVWAGAAHETMLWSRMGGNGACNFTADNVLADYSAVTGFDPSNPDTDQGTDMQKAAAYRRNVGVIDDCGKRHKVAAYLALDPGDLDDLYYAMYLFGAVGIGFMMPGSAMKQFEQKKPWSVLKGAEVDGGHYVSGVCRRGNPACVTWGVVQPFTAGFYSKYNDEAVAYVSPDALTNNRSPEGFDLETLIADLEPVRLAALASGNAIV